METELRVAVTST